MKKFEGVNLLKEKCSGSEQSYEFIILKEERDNAIESLVKVIDSGSIVTLNDNRDKREGSISLKKEKDTYMHSGGGHGFSIDWEPKKLEDIIWLIKITSPFNYGENEGDFGSIKERS